METPIAICFALYTAIRHRYQGVEAGPGYFDRLHS
jgi:hypothetical protein